MPPKKMILIHYLNSTHTTTSDIIFVMRMHYVIVCKAGVGAVEWYMPAPGLNWTSWAVSHSHTLPLHPLPASANFSLECPSVLGISGCTVLITGRCRGFYNTATVVDKSCFILLCGKFPTFIIFLSIVSNLQVCFNTTANINMNKSPFYS